MTLHHPHGQIYAYPFVPPIPARELRAAARATSSEHGRGLLEDLIARRARGRPAHALRGPQRGGASCRSCARYPYEVWVAPRRAAPLGRRPRRAPSARDFARALKTVLLKYDGLWEQAVPVPPGRSTRRRPTASRIPEAHLHIEFYPALPHAGTGSSTSPGSELGAGVFTADTLPEEKAAELQRGAR